MDFTEEKHIRAQVRKILSEEIIKEPHIPGTLNFWHGGDLDSYDDIIAQKNGRYEYGPGFYAITHYDTALKYAKGSRKLYLVTVEKGIDIQYALLDVSAALDFIKSYVIGSKRKEILRRLQKYFTEDGKIKAYIFNNVMLNEKAIKSTNIMYLREFYINNGIDYEIIHSPFGWAKENMIVLYNMKKVVNVIRVKSGDKIENYELNKNN
jgi:hypothetical protein